MDNVTKYKLSLFKDIKNLNDKGSVILSYSLTDDRICVKKFVNPATAEIYMKIKDTEKGFLPEIYDIIDCTENFLIVEEYISGKSVERIISENGIIEEKTACGYIRDILRVLEGVHNLDIIHRDISPGNVIIDEAGRARLLDFDIARTVKAPKSTDTVILGTAGFASPEQYGFAQTDCRSDIYSVGALFNYMLTGTIIQNKIYDKEPVRSVIKKAASFEPDRRYSSCRDMLKEKCFSGSYKPKPRPAEKEQFKSIEDILFRIPGFRTHSKLKAVTALFIYLLIVMSIINRYNETGSLYEAFLFFADSLIIIVYPMWWFGNRGKNWDMIPFINQLNPGLKKIAAVIIYLAVTLILCGIIPQNT